ncbi:DUF6879 family protein [Streptomyces sp. NPDC002766]
MHRVRVVERPVVPYIQWKLTLLRVKNEYKGPLPEVCALGDEAVW